MRRRTTLKRILLVVAGAALCSGIASADPGPISMKLDDLGHGTYRLEGSFKLSVTPYDAWRVLTDYEHIKDFVSSLRKSEVKASTTDRLLLEQEALGKEFIFSKRIKVLLQVTEIPYKRILFEDVSHTDFAFYEGSWEILPVPNGIEAVYRLNCKRLFTVPNTLAKDALKRSATDLLAEVRAEIIKRHQLSSARAGSEAEETYRTGS